jgi:hypothetical protein
MMQQIAFGAYYLAFMVNVVVSRWRAGLHRIPCARLLLRRPLNAVTSLPCHRPANRQLYLPRNSYGVTAPRSRVMVGAQHLSPPNRHQLSPGGHLASNALMSLLREGGQWDEIDDQAFERTPGHSTPRTTVRGASKLYADRSYRLKSDQAWDDDGASGTTQPPIVVHKESDPELGEKTAPKALKNWQSPFEVPTMDELPTQLKIMVQREVEHDGELGGR